MYLITLDIETNIHTRQPVVIAVGTPTEQRLVRPNDPAALIWMLRELATPGAVVVGHNVSFDMAILQKWGKEFFPELHNAIWQLYTAGQVSDTMIREKLIRNAQGTLSADDGFSGDSYSLAAVANARLGPAIGEALLEEKRDPQSWRMRFHELEALPTAEWPAPAVDYCLGDVHYPREIWYAQLKADPRLPLYTRSTLTAAKASAQGQRGLRPLEQSTGFLINEVEQVRAALALQLMTEGGIYCDPVRTEELAVQWAAEVAAGEEAAKRYFTPAKHSQTKTVPGWDIPPLPKKKNVKRLREDVEAHFINKGQPAPRTDPSARNPWGQVKVNVDTLERIDDPQIKALVDMADASKLLTSFLPVLREGSTTGVHASYDVLKATGRTSCFGPNLQQLPRKGGVRECFVARPGYVFIQADYAQIELCALAQAQLFLLKRSSMANAIREGKDLHLVTASTLLGRTYADVLANAKTDPKVKEARQLSKAANFGFPGGMGPDKFIDYARVGYGLTLTVQQASDLKKAWLAAYPEMKLYFGLIGAHTQVSGYWDVRQLVSGRIRGNCGFCDGANTYFQGLAADGAKDALWQVAREVYYSSADPTSPSYSPLVGCIGGVFVHDEIILEAPEATAPQAARRLGEVMVASMVKFIPDVPVKAEPLMMRRWYKDAEPLFDTHGNLVVWEPAKSA